MIRIVKTAYRRGFTLIELLVVIAIIGILAGVIVPRVAGFIPKGRDAARVTAANNLVRAVERMNLEKGGYPSAAFCLNKTDDTLIGGNIGDPAYTVSMFVNEYMGGSRPDFTSAGLEGFGCNDGVQYYLTTVTGASYGVAVAVELPAENGNAAAQGDAVAGLSPVWDNLNVDGDTAVFFAVRN